MPIEPLTSPWGPVAGVVFDFDGVIVESVDIKTEAFLELFADRPEHRTAIRDYQEQNVGMSRYRKFEWLFRELFLEPLTEELSRELGRRYSAAVFDKVLACEMVPGAIELLRDLQGRCPAFVASGTPEEELLQVVDRRGLTPFFRTVCGSPTLKPVLMEGFRSELGCRPEELLMIGDGISDLRDAEAAGTRFVGRIFADRPSPFLASAVPVVRDLHELSDLLGLDGSR